MQDYMLIVLVIWLFVQVVHGWQGNSATSRLQINRHVQVSSSKIIKHTSSQRALYFSKRDNVDGLRIDVSKLDPEEQKRLAFIQKLTLEADEMARSAGFQVDPEDANPRDMIDLEKSVEDTNWSGQSVAYKTRFSTNNTLDLLNRPGLAFGDISALLIFASIGRGNHGENLDILSILNTAWPFVLSWAVISPFLGAYSNAATESRGKIAWGMLPAWFCSVASALAIRGYIKEYIPPTPFIAVSFIATFVLLITWRNVYILAFGETAEGEYRKGGFFEIFSMITSLIKRW